ncbi:M48 family metalloprotease [Aquisalimonas asiatica]|uniref:Zn-dependent protease with chaperone function n=1 Tax=Aquisalimonas asiatica TaxID=406100 RepID=A0A1H8TJE1_9GAMM|nr:M48 family metalloprotease [Aquisalimonas asiatica]SEO90965.1 Zn-dependent protease with chaperone function [Aquisalimonas asiatica]
MPTAFFERQKQARWRTAYLLLLFTGVVLGLLVVLNGALLFALEPALLMGGARGVSMGEAVSGHATVLSVATGVALLGLGFFTARMALRLRAGGRVIAVDMGADAVQAATTDPAERRLRNVVGEMALAAGVIAPGVYVMQREPGINAFAAGFAPSDAVVVVTRGALDRLERDELQGVVAHEFSHIVNGDTRLNTLLIAIVHGLEALAISSGDHVGARHGGHRPPATLVLGWAAYVAGLLGVLCSRLVKAAIVRQREWLADAAAVQYTRYPEGLAGALKKIAAGRRLGSALLAPRRREVSHMLFAPGLGFADEWPPLLASHPPVARRIEALDPRFDAGDLDAIRDAMLDAMRRRAQEAGEEADDRATPAAESVLAPGADTVTHTALIAAATGALVAGSDQARALHAGVPGRLSAAARSRDEVAALVLCLLLADDAVIRRQQLDAVESCLGGGVRATVAALLAEYGRPVQPRDRLPLLELALPTLADVPEDDARRLIAAAARIARLDRIDGRIRVHAYALLRLLQIRLQAHAHGHARADASPLYRVLDSAAVVMALFAWHAHAGDHTLAEQAYARGMDAMLVPRAPAFHVPDDWVVALTGSLRSLEGLDADGKRCLVTGLLAVVVGEDGVGANVAELLRVVTVSLQFPLPLVLPGDALVADAT